MRDKVLQNESQRPLPLISIAGQQMVYGLGVPPSHQSVPRKPNIFSLQFSPHPVAQDLKNVIVGVLWIVLVISSRHSSVFLKQVSVRMISAVFTPSGGSQIGRVDGC